jgi:hypothetical protein
MGAALNPNCLLQGCGHVDPGMCRVDIFHGLRPADETGS